MKRYTVSICLLIKDENRYLSEWLEWHIKQGAEHFYIYDNGSQIPIEHDIPEQYKDFCTVVDWSGLHRHIQIDAYQNCLERFGTETEWMAFIDTDEFIRAVNGINLPELLSCEEYKNADAIAVGWVTYNANQLLTRDDRPVRERFTQTVEYPAHLPQCKCIVRTDRVHMMGPHHPIATNQPLAVLDEAGNIHHSPTQSTPKSRLVVDHYFTRSYEEWQEKMARGSCDPNYVRDNNWFAWMNPEIQQK